MTGNDLHPLARDYVERLRRAAAALPGEQRDELVQQIEAHLAETAPDDATEVDVRTALDRLGDPADIVAEAGPPEPAPAGSRRGTHEWLAIFGLLLGGFVVPVVGWIAGVILLWTSQAWTTRDKIIGTVLVPGGLGLPPFIALALIHPGAAGTPLAAAVGVGALFILPLATAIYLAKRAQAA